MKKISLLVFASCALLTACVEHDKCYEVAEPTTECACHKAPTCGCQKSCGCASAPAVQPVVPAMQPKTVVVVVPAKPQPQRHILTPEIVYPEPRACGCKRR